MPMENLKKLFADNNFDFPYCFEDREEYKVEDNFTKIYGTGIDNIRIIENFISDEEIEKGIALMQRYPVIWGRTHCYPVQLAPGFDNPRDLIKFSEDMATRMRDAAIDLWGGLDINLGKHTGAELMVHPTNTYLNPHTDILDIDYENNDPDHDEGPTQDEQLKTFKNMWSGHMAMLIYLNDDYENGDLYFTNQDYHFKPKRGTLVTFPGSLHYVHGVTPITEGMRYTVSGWGLISIMKDEYLL
jgi:hypothetical protein